MKLTLLKEKLKEKIRNNNHNQQYQYIHKEYLNNNISTISSVNSALDKLQIIGITGSTGKSTTAYLVHKYLQRLGYKSILYSSVMVDSPISYTSPNVAYDVAVRSEEALLEIIEEAEIYQVDYLILEINENTIAKGIVKDVPFNVRVLTNLNSKHNEEEYTEEEYTEIKKSFFKDIDNPEECICVIGFEDYSKKLLDELLNINSCHKLIFGSNYIFNKNGVDINNVNCVLTDLNLSLSGMKMEAKLNGNFVKFETKMIMSYNALNILGAITIVEALNKFNQNQFDLLLKENKIPGREEIFEKNNRMIIIDFELSKVLECLKTIKERKEINQIIVVVGAVGYGFKYWEEKYKSEEYQSSRHLARQFAMEILKKYADKVYLTENDNAKEDVLDISKELQVYLNNEIVSTIIIDREEAIYQAIKNSNEKDVIFISGRGNRNILCDSETTMKIMKDSDAVIRTFQKLGW